MTTQPPSSDAPALPDGDPADTPRGPLHIPGAGTIGMTILIISLSVLFLASMLAFFLIRMQYLSGHPGATWPPAGSPHVPRSLWGSTLVIILTSVTIQSALTAIRRDQDRALRVYLKITFFLGALFLVLQSLNWWEFIRAFPDNLRNGVYYGGFLVMTGLHAAHVLGGLIPLPIVHHLSSKGRYSRNFHPGVRYLTVYWHFLDIVWLFVFLMIYL